MEIIALVVVGVVALGTCTLLAQILRYRERTWERKEASWLKTQADLINRVMYLTDRPWMGPPEVPQMEITQEDKLLIYPDMEVLD